VFFERRGITRYSFGKTRINIRIPQKLSRTEKTTNLEEAINSARAELQANPQLLAQYHITPPEYREGAMLRIRGQIFILRKFIVNKKTGAAWLDGDELLSPAEARLRGIQSPPVNIIMELPAHFTDDERNEMADGLISLCVGDFFINEIDRRVREVNDRHFGHRIRSVRLKNVKARWGSCSAAGNLNLSTRLLCAPPEVVDYVIIHELAHVGLYNHSQKFWDRVRKAMPDYRVHIQWLKDNGETCSFDKCVCGYEPPVRAAACARQDADESAPAASPRHDDAQEPPPGYIERQISLSFDFE
jgi:hypothetical protein